jgi:hypothetical protein
LNVRRDDAEAEGYRYSIRAIHAYLGGGYALDLALFPVEILVVFSLELGYFEIDSR